MALLQEFNAPTINWGMLAPVIVLLGAGTFGVLIGAFLPRRIQWMTQVGIAVVALVVALGSTVLLWGSIPSFAHTATGANKQPFFSLVLDGPTLTIWAVICFLALISVLIMCERGDGNDTFVASAASIPTSPYEDQARRSGLVVSEVFPLMLFSTGGMLAFAASRDLISMFVALEVFSLPLYILCGLSARRRLISQEASLKYFLLGAFSSAIFLFGGALMTGLFQTTALKPRGGGVLPLAETPGLVIVGVVFVFVGVLFKVGAVPFHTWTPDVYEGAPTPVTGYMAACTKIAAFAALLNVSAWLGPFQPVWSLVIAITAAASMILGVLVALRQESVKRVLAYSSIAHAGFILVALTTMRSERTAAVLAYLIFYGIATIGAFAVVALVRERGLDGSVSGEARGFEQWRGLSQHSPILAASFTVFLLGMAGIPLTSGFIGKFAVFRVAVESGYAWLAVIGVLCSAVAAYFYVRIVVAMYSKADSPKSVSIADRRPLTMAAVLVGVVATLVLGVFPGPVLDLAQSAANAVVQ